MVAMVKKNSKIHYSFQGELLSCKDIYARCKKYLGLSRYLLSFPIEVQVENRSLLPFRSSWYLSITAAAERIHKNIQIEKSSLWLQVQTPTSYKKRQGLGTPHPLSENPCKWCSSSVVAILEYRAYTGYSVNFKTFTNSIWDKKQWETPQENHAVFPDTHERIIEDDVIEKVQEIRQQHRQTIRIKYDGIGCIPPDVLMNGKTA